MASPFGNIEWNPISRNNSALVNIILLCTYVFILSSLLNIFPQGVRFLNFFKLTSNLGLLIYQPFSIVSYIFMHGGFWHLLGNMLWLYFIGIILEDLTGHKHLWRLFLGGGI
ncbi:MAG: rhomboid family intramembrane serine protease, partial [Bacteroidia bacterium]|nr:rhomboid family intramembrane serine protease [Bacteroidia bacterium]